MLIDAHLVQVDAAGIVQAPDQRALHRGRLLMDLLVHERIPTALLRGRRIPIHLEHGGILHHVAIEIGDRHTPAWS